MGATDKAATATTMVQMAQANQLTVSTDQLTFLFDFFFKFIF